MTESEARSGPHSSFSATGVLHAVVGTVLLYFLRFGYDFGHSDQDEWLPYLSARLDENLFLPDWFVQYQLSQFNVRTGFVTLLEPLARVFPTWVVVLTVYAATLSLLAAAVFQLSDRFLNERPAAFAATVLILVLTPQWSLGGNELAHRMLVPSMAAWCLGLWGFVDYLRARRIRTAFWLAGATWLQPLVGVQLFGVVVIDALIRGVFGKTRGEWRRTAGMTAVYLLISGTVLWKLAAETAPLNTLPGTGPDLFFILAEFRVPHHYLPSAFPAASICRFAVLLVLGSVCLGLRSGFGRREWTLIHSVLLVMAVAAVVGWVGTTVFRSLFVAKLQLFKFTVLAEIFLIVTVVWQTKQWMPASLMRTGRRWMQSASVLWIWPPVIAALCVVILSLDSMHDRWLPAVRHKTTALHEAENWLRENSPVSSLVMTPPSISSFRFHAKRAQVINFKSVPFTTGALYVWYDRLSAVAPHPRRRGTTALQEDLDTAFERLALDTLASRCVQFHVDYVLRRTAIEDPFRYRRVFANSEWYVYAVDYATLQVPFSITERRKPNAR